MVATGPIATEYNKNRSVQVTKDAVYYLNYSKGRLLAAVPLQRQTATASQIMSEFAERDLVADFQLAPGTHPHFVMTTGTLGALDGEGWAPLIVFESTTGQMAAYRVEVQSTSGSSRPAFRLIERMQDARLAQASWSCALPVRDRHSDFKRPLPAKNLSRAGCRASSKAS